MNERPLMRHLHLRHLQLLMLAAVIGAGFFTGAGATVKLAGPAVIISYALGGLVGFLVMLLLAEMSASMPVAGSFQSYATLSLGRWAGFVTGWTYWLAFLIGPASESMVAAGILHDLFPIVPFWVFILLIVAMVTGVCLCSVRIWGETTFWLGFIKVTALLVFIAVGALVILLLPRCTPGIREYHSLGGFAPHGLGGVLRALVLVVFAYGGIEAVGAAAEESRFPKRDLPRTLVRTTAALVVLYMLATAVLVGILPWSVVQDSAGPYVDAVAVIGGSLWTGTMGFVILTAAISCMIAGVYATSRILFSLAREGYFPASLARVEYTRAVPAAATLASCGFLLVAALVFHLFSDFAYLWLASLSGFGFLFTWLMIALAHPGMRRLLTEMHPQGLPWRAPLCPWLQRLTVVLLVGIMASLLLVPDGWMILAAGAAWLVIASIYFHAVVARRSRRS